VRRQRFPDRGREETLQLIESGAEGSFGHFREEPMAPKPAKKASATSDKPQNAFQKLLQPSAELAAIVGTDPVSRGEVTSKVWDYIKSHNLQNPENRREILADDKLRKVFGKDKLTMFEMTKYLSQHLK
jgi:upstream activation factor subunit UAF30